MASTPPTDGVTLQDVQRATYHAMTGLGLHPVQAAIIAAGAVRAAKDPEAEVTAVLLDAAAEIKATGDAFAKIIRQATTTDTTDTT